MIIHYSSILNKTGEENFPESITKDVILAKNSIFVKDFSNVLPKPFPSIFYVKSNSNVNKWI